MPSFQILVLGFAVRFLSLFPDSLPQLFLRCLPYAFAFGLFPFLSAFFRLLLFRFWLLGLCFFLSSFFPFFPSQWVIFRCFPSALASLVFLFLSSLISHAFLPDSSYSAFCSFPFILPSFAPTAVPLVLPFCFRLRAFPFPFCFLSSASVPVLTTQPLLLLFLFLPAFPSQWFLRCSSSAFAS